MLIDEDWKQGPIKINERNDANNRCREFKKKYAKVKFGCKTEFIDAKARSTLKIIKTTTSMIKCAHGNDHCGERDAMMNKCIKIKSIRDLMK